MYLRYLCTYTVCILLPLNWGFPFPPLALSGALKPIRGSMAWLLNRALLISRQVACCKIVPTPSASKSQSYISIVVRLHHTHCSSSRHATPSSKPHLTPMASLTPEANSKKVVQEPRPSSSVLLLSATNEVLLLHRVKTSTSFASAYVFPGGNLDAFHDGKIPAADSPERHRDGAAYRFGAIRETFEETGILLATKDGALVTLSTEQRDEARVKIHNNKVRFGDFLTSIGAVADTGMCEICVCVRRSCVFLSTSYFT